MMKWIVLLMGMFFFLGCKKGQGDFMLTGTITDKTFSQAHQGSLAKLYKVPVGTTQQILIGSVSIGPDGVYKFSFPRDKMEKYILKVEKVGYFDIQETIYFSSLDLKEENIRNYSTTAKSWIRISIKNNMPVDSDTFQYIKQQGKANCAECCPIDQKTLNGAVDTSIYCINDGNTLYSIYYFATGMTGGTIEGVVTNAFDTTELLINY
jgi:hypothetical protein